MEFLGIIPSRYASTRFPGKPLIDINGKPMIQHVYENASQVVDELYVATDDERIKKAVENFGGNVIMTSEHNSGTDRCREAYEIIMTRFNKSFDVIINIQGDEPFINKDHILRLKSLFLDRGAHIGTIIKRVSTEQELYDKSIPKVVFNNSMEAMYFSRLPIPFKRNYKENEQIDPGSYFKHIGIYAYKSEVLREITDISPSSLELTESLEQLRWLQNGYKILLSISEFDSFSIDTPEDYKNLLSGL